MVQFPPFTPKPVMSATLHIYVDGVEREHIKANWGIDTSGGLPDSLINAGTGMRSRTGSITWAPNTAVVAAPYFDDDTTWAPQDGMPVVIDAEIGGATYRRFTGRLGKSTISLVDGSVESEITDTLGDSLQEVMSIEPMVTYGTGFVRSGWVAYRAIEQAGLGAVPKVDENTIAHSSFQQGALPVVGTVIDQGQGTSDAQGFNIRSGTKIGVQAGLTRSKRSVLCIGRGSTNNDSQISLVLDDSSQLRLYYRVSDNKLFLDIDNVNKWQADYTGDEIPPLLALQVKTTGEIRVWTGRDTPIDTGVTFSVDSNANSILGDSLSGFTAQYLWVDKQALAVVSSTNRLMPKLMFSALEQKYLNVIRGYENVTARSIIDEWCEATLGSIWMDEYGRVNLVARDRLVTSYATGKDRVDEKVFTGSWENGRDGVRSGVVIEGQQNILKGTWVGRTATVYQPSSIQELDFNVLFEDFINIPDDEDWIDVDLDWKVIRDTYRGINNIDAFNDSKDGSYWQISFQSPDDRDFIAIPGADRKMTGEIERVSQRSFKTAFIVEDVAGISTKNRWVLATPTNLNGWYSTNKGQPTPILRAKWRVVWSKFSVQSAYKGDAWAPTMKLNSDWFLDIDDARRIADAIGQEVTTKTITLSNLSMLWNPQVQVGDTRTLIGYGFDGVDYIDSWEADYLITGYDESWDGNVPTWSCSAQCKKLTSLIAGKTYYDLGEAYGRYASIESTNATYQGVYDALPGKA